MTTYTAEHHAVLYALISRQLRSFIPDPEEYNEVIRSFTVTHGLRRGRYRREFADQNGLAPDMVTYRALAEWEIDNSGVSKEFVQRFPYEIVKNLTCPWHEAWKKYDLMEEGHNYCKYIDAALLRGFNEDLRMQLLSVHTDGVSDCCEFHWLDYEASEENQKRMAELRAKFQGQVVLSWERMMLLLVEDMRTVCSRVLGDRMESMECAIYRSFETIFQNDFRLVVEKCLHE